MLTWYDYLSSRRGINNSIDIKKIVKKNELPYKKLLKDYLPRDKDLKIYEAACGPGIMLNVLKQFGYSNLSGSDLSSTAISIALDSGLNVKNANSIEDLLQIQDGTLGVIFAIDFIEHLEKNDLTNFISIAKSKLQDDGSLIMRFPNGDSPFVGLHLFNDITHIWTYTSVAIIGVLEMGGFRRFKFLDERFSYIDKGRFYKIPIVRLISACLRVTIKLVTGIEIKIFSPSVWIVAK